MLNPLNQARLHDSHTTCSSELAREWTSLLGAPVELTLTQIENQTYSQFIQSIPAPNCFYTIDDEQSAVGCIKLSPTVAFPMLGRLLGGSEYDAAIPQRPLTSIEQSICLRILEPIVNC